MAESLDEMANRLDGLSAQIAQRQPDAINLLNTVYREIFNETIKQGCGNCYQKAFYRVQKFLFLNNNIPMKKVTDRKYLLKPDRQLQTTFGGDTLTNDNLTDEIAESLIAEFPALLQHFDKYPGSEPDEEQPDQEDNLINDGNNDDHLTDEEQLDQEGDLIKDGQNDDHVTDEDLNSFFKSLTKAKKTSFLKTAKKDIEADKTDFIITVDGVDKDVTIAQLKALVEADTQAE